MDRISLRDDESRTIIRNFTFLSIIQGTNFILPLLVLPYLIFVIGVDRFGMVSFAQAFMSYFIVFTDYGFNLTATRDISIAKDDNSKLSSIVSKTLLTKLIICAISFCVLMLVLSIFPYFSAHAALYYYSFLLVIGQVLIPAWFFQGIEQLKYLSYINLLAKIIFTILIFVCITKPGDFIYVPVFYSLGNIVSGIVALTVIVRKFKIRLYYPTGFRFARELKNGWPAFISNFSINAYISSNLFILALFANSTITGYYSIADKLLYAFRQLLNIFFNAIYPQACQKAVMGYSHLKQFFKKYFPPFFIGVFLLCLAAFITAKPIAMFLSTSGISEITFAIRLLSFVPVIICLNIPAFQTLLVYQYQKSYMMILLAGSLLNIALNLVLAPVFNMKGTAISVICTEIFITAGLYIVLATRHKNETLTKPGIL